MSNVPKYLLVGDTHGALDSVRDAIHDAKRSGVNTMIQLGDWGFLWNKSDQVKPLAKLLRDAKMVMWFIDGNHDMHTVLETYDFPKELVFMPRGSMKTLDNGIRIGFLGGAASIDQDHRVAGVSWWATEMPAMEQVDKLGPCDVLITHDSPVLPYGLAPWPGLSQRIQVLLDRSREIIAAAVDRTGAKKCFTGHYHVPRKTSYKDCEVNILSNNGKPGATMLVDEFFNEVPWQSKLSDV